MRRHLLLGILAAAGLWGCGKSESDTPRYNTVLGGSPTGAPLVAGSSDVGITQSDQTTYKRSSHPSIGAAGATPDAGAAAGGGDGETEAVRAVFRSAADSLLTFSAEGFLDAFVPREVEALRGDFQDGLQNLLNQLDTFIKAVEAKFPDKPQFQKVRELPNKLIGAIVASIEIEVIDESHATATGDFRKYIESITPLLLELAAESGAVGTSPETSAPSVDDSRAAADTSAPAPTEDAGQPEPSATAGQHRRPQYKLAKVENAWRIEIEHAFTSDEATALMKLVELSRDFLAAAGDRVEAEQSLDAAKLFEIINQVNASMAMKFAAVLVEIDMVSKSSETGEEGEKKPDEPKKPDEGGDEGNPRRPIAPTP